MVLILNLSGGVLGSEFGMVSINDEWYKEGGVSEDAPWIGELLGGYHLSLEYRFYLGEKEGFNGFYIAPFTRFWKYDVELEDEINGDYFDIDAHIRSIGMGAQFGYQWLISDMIVIDFYFVGIGVQQLAPQGSYVINPERASFDYSTIVDDVTDDGTKFQC